MNELFKNALITVVGLVIGILLYIVWGFLSVVCLSGISWAGELAVFFLFVYVSLFFLIFMFSSSCVILAKWLAIRFNIVDIPDGKIKNHENITPYLGGVAVYIVSSIPLLYVMCTDFFLFNNRLNNYEFVSVLTLFIGSTILLFVGLVDDIKALLPGQKFIGQCIAVLFFLYGGWYIHCSLLGVLLSALWILAIINAFNLIDVMDGLASSVAISAFCGLAMIGSNYLPFFFLWVAAVLFGFLRHNWPPASIYLGDAGSLFIGGLLGVLTLKISPGQHGYNTNIVPVIILAIPLLELITLIIVRTYKKIPFYKASPDHFSLYLKKNGWSKKKILRFVFIMMFITNITAYGIVAEKLNALQILCIATIFFFIWFNCLIYGSFLPYKKYL